MNTTKRLSKVYESAEEFVFDDSLKVVLMSDCHRGKGDWADEFSKNQNICFVALNHYYNKGYTYIEVGDGDELWENRNFSDVKRIHSHIFWLLSKFYKENRLKFIFGNHDMVKKNPTFVKSNMYEYYDEENKKNISLFKDIKIHEGLILKYNSTNNKIFLVHGHQGDLLNDRFWRLSRFLVRYLWRPLNMFGVKDPTSAAENHHKKHKVEKRLIKWAKSEKQMLIAGHTHRPMVPEMGEPLYFNIGSCVHPRCITAIELEFGNISLVKWYVNTKEDGTLFIDRKVLVGPQKLKDYFKASENK